MGFLDDLVGRESADAGATSPVAAPKEGGFLSSLADSEPPEAENKGFFASFGQGVSDARAGVRESFTAAKRIAIGQDVDIEGEPPDVESLAVRNPELAESGTSRLLTREGAGDFLGQTVTSSSPFLMATVAGGFVGGLPGAMVAGGVAAGAQALGDLYLDMRRRGLDHKSAVDRATNGAIGSSFLNAMTIPIAGVMPFKKALGNALFQLYTQTVIGGADTARQNMVAGRDPNLGVAESMLGEAMFEAPATVGAIRSTLGARGKPAVDAEATPAGTPGSPTDIGPIDGTAQPEATPQPAEPVPDVEVEAGTEGEVSPDEAAAEQDRTDLDEAIRQAEEEAQKVEEADATPPEQAPTEEPVPTPAEPPVEPVPAEQQPEVAPEPTPEPVAAETAPSAPEAAPVDEVPEAVPNVVNRLGGLTDEQLAGYADRLEVGGKPVESKQPFRATLYNGYGREAEPELYSEGAGAIFGKGLYLSLKPDRAEAYGPKVREVKLNVRKPFVVQGSFDLVTAAAKSDAGVAALERASAEMGKGTRWLDEHAKSPAEEAAKNRHTQAIFTEAANNLRAEGYDAIYVEVPQTSDTNRQGAPLKRYRELFEETQVFVLADSAIESMADFSDASTPPVDVESPPPAEDVPFDIPAADEEQALSPIKKRGRGRPRKHPRPEVMEAIKEGRKRIAKALRRIKTLERVKPETLIKAIKELGGIRIEDVKAQYDWQVSIVERGLDKIPGLWRRKPKGMDVGTLVEKLRQSGDIDPEADFEDVLDAINARTASAKGAGVEGEVAAELGDLREAVRYEEGYLRTIEEIARRNPDMTLEEVEDVFAREHDGDSVARITKPLLSIHNATAADLYMMQDEGPMASDLPEPPPPPEKMRIPRRRTPEEPEEGAKKKPKWPKQPIKRSPGQADHVQYWFDRAADFVSHVKGTPRELWGLLTNSWMRPMIERVEGGGISKAGQDDFRSALKPTRPLIGKTIAKMARRAIDRGAHFYGKWTPAFTAYLEMIDGKGKGGLQKRRTYAELNQRVDSGSAWNGTEGTYAYNRFADAVENDDAFSTLSPLGQKVVTAARGLVRMTGLDAEGLGVQIMDRGVLELFKASRDGKRFIRNFTHHFYNIMRNPVANAEAFATIIRAITDANFIEPDTTGMDANQALLVRMQAFQEQAAKWSRVIRKRTPSHRHRVLGKVRERAEAFEIARQIPNFPTEIKIGSQWVKLMDDDPFTWALKMQRRGAARLGFISTFGQFRHDVDAIADTYEASGGERRHMVDLLNALQLNPIDNPSPFAVGSAPYKARMFMDETLGVFRGLLLSGSFAPNVMEGPAKIPAVFGGRRYAAELAHLIARGGFDPIVLAETARIAGRTIDVVNANFDRRNIPAALTRLMRQVLLYPNTKANEMTEFIAAATGLRMAEDLLAGRGTRLDAYRLRSLLKFAPAEVRALMAGTASQDLYEAVVRRGVAWSQNTISQPAEKSRLNASRWWNRFVIADTYAQMTAARTADITHAAWTTALEQIPALAAPLKGETPAARRAEVWARSMKAMDNLYPAARVTANYFGGAVVAGTLSQLFASLLFRGPEDVERTIEEWAKDPKTWMTDVAIYSLVGGAMAMLMNGVAKGSPGAVAFDLAQNLLPVRAATEIYNADLMNPAGRGAGGYRGMSYGERFDVFMDRNMMVNRFFKAWGPAVFVGNRDPEFEVARRRYWQWMRKHVGIDTHIEGKAEELETLAASRAEQDRFIGLMVKATAAVRRGDKPSAFWGPIKEAVEMRGTTSVRQSLSGRRMLPKVPKAAWEQFKADMSPKDIEALRRYDRALMMIAEGLKGE